MPAIEANKERIYLESNMNLIANRLTAKIDKKDYTSVIKMQVYYAWAQFDSEEAERRWNKKHPQLYGLNCATVKTFVINKVGAI